MLMVAMFDCSDAGLRHVLFAVLVALLGGGWLVGPAGAQSPVTSIENADETLRLQLNSDGGFYVPGNYEGAEASGDSIPATGAGTRMMWYPAKAAFRAGHVDNFFGDGAVEWDASNIGRTSVAFNYNSTASGPHSFAAGTKTIASGVSSTAMGFLTEATDTNAVAMGTGSTANAPRAMAVGNYTTASGENSFAAGFATEASGGGAFTTGFGTEAGGVHSFATGDRTKATGSLSAAMGNITTAATANSLSIGRCNSANTSSDGSLLVAGNGSRSGDSCSSRSDALRLDFNGNMTIAGTLTESSDRRLKTDIEELGSVLGDLEDIDPVRFRFKEDTGHPSDPQIGLVAQEVQKAFPELVKETTGGYLSLAYPKFSAVLLKGMQEQQREIEEQEKKIHELENRINDISERMSTLEAQSSSPLPAGLSASGILVGFLLGGCLSAGLLWRRRAQE